MSLDFCDINRMDAARGSFYENSSRAFHVSSLSPRGQN